MGRIDNGIWATYKFSFNKMITRAQKNTYRVRYVKVLENLSDIQKMQPREQYLYRLMNTVIFHDFETALDVVMEDFKQAHNDNHNHEGLQS